jgi:hypothetical protein
MHAPAVHVAVAGHVLPHAPQFVALVVVSTQRPPQSMRPAGHAEQTPAVQVPVAAHMLPHAPQLLMSVCVLTQAPPHTT